MRVHTNVMALNAWRNLSVTSASLSKSLERLSSGLRINRAADDAAGLAISEKMRGQIRGLNQAARNAQDGISLIQTAEGALNESHAILQRMRELAVQAANSTYTSDDRAEIQKEIDQLKQELDRIAATTEFNTKKLLNGSAAATATVSGTNTAKIDTAEVVNALLPSGTYTLVVSGTANQGIANVLDGGTGLTSGDITLANPSVAKYGSYQLRVEDDVNNAGRKTVTLIDAITGQVIASQNNVQTGAGAPAVQLQGIQVAAANITGNGTVSFTVEGDHTFTLLDAGGNQLASVTVKDYNRPYVDIQGLRVSFNADLTDSPATPDTTITIMNNSLVFHIGANENQTMNVALNDMSARALGVSDLNVTSVQGAESSISTVDTAIARVSAERSKLGAFQNRLEHTIANLQVASENLTAAESRIRDADMAQEMMEFVRNQILLQSGTAMLAQANAVPQSVLQLLA